MELTCTSRTYNLLYNFRHDWFCKAQLGSMSQSDLVGGGLQCTCVALSFICVWSTLSSHHGTDNLFQQDSVDAILRDGTVLYNKHFKSRCRYIMVSELPSSAEVRGIQYNCVQSEIFSGLVNSVQSVHESQTFSLTDAVTNAFSRCPSCLLTLGDMKAEMGYTTAAVVHDNGKILVFDSHSRNELGMPAAAGKAVLLEVSSISHFVLYARQLAKALFKNSADVPFEVVCLTCDKVSILNSTSQSEALENSRAQRQQQQQTVKM